jgi:hypothetical protein
MEWDAAISYIFHDDAYQYVALLFAVKQLADWDGEAQISFVVTK